MNFIQVSFNRKPNYCRPDFLLYTELASAWSLKKFTGGKGAVLWCDESMEKVYTKLGVTGLWSDIKRLPPVDKDISQKDFWTIQKIQALTATPAPVTSVDNDLVIWGNLDFKWDGITALKGLHWDNMEWGAYWHNHRMFENYGLRDWPFAAPALNAGIMTYHDEILRKAYVDKFWDFCARYTADARRHHNAGGAVMMFSEQQLPVMIALKSGLIFNAYVPIKRSARGEWLPESMPVMHLWGIKKSMETIHVWRHALINRIYTELKAAGEYKVTEAMEKCGYKHSMETGCHTLIKLDV